MGGGGEREYQDKRKRDKVVIRGLERQLGTVMGRKKKRGENHSKYERKEEDGGKGKREEERKRRVKSFQI